VRNNLGKSDGKVGVIAEQLCSFLISALPGVSNQLHAPSASPQGKSPSTERRKSSLKEQKLSLKLLAPESYI
jgi:hypothetical protein